MMLLPQKIHQLYTLPAQYLLSIGPTKAYFEICGSIFFICFVLLTSIVMLAKIQNELDVALKNTQENKLMNRY